jgi:Na+/melibiose symporter-like transporter
MNNLQVEKLPLGKKIIYALGQLGWSLGSYSVGNLLVYFYMPPEEAGKQVIFEPRIFQGSILGFLTIIGIIFAAGRLFDAVTDPLIAGWSDRSESKFGRRKKFLLIGGLPFAIFSVLVFVPITNSVSTINSLWLAFTVFMFYFFMTMYVTPFFALLSELGHNPKERLLLSTMISMTWAIGFALGTQAVGLQGHFEKSMSMDSFSAFQTTMTIFAVISAIFMYLPVIFINEKRYCEPNVSKEGPFEAIKNALKNKNFLVFLYSDLAYWAALIFISSGMIYYVTTLLQLPKETYSWLMLVMFVFSFLFYVPVYFISLKTGKKKLLIVGFFLFGITYVFTFFLGKFPFSMIAQGYLIAICAAVPIAIFGILPNAIIADIAEADGIITNNFKSGVFFGARTFMSKVGQMLGALILPSLLLLGKTVENDIGIRLTGAAALVFLILGLVFFLKYDEVSILKTLASKEKLSEQELDEIEKLK